MTLGEPTYVYIGEQLVSIACICTHAVLCRTDCDGNVARFRGDKNHQQKERQGVLSPTQNIIDHYITKNTLTYG